MHGAFRVTLSTDTSSEAGNSLLPFLEPSSSTWGCRLEALGAMFWATESKDAADPLECSEQVTIFGHLYH